jgi:hypothetical protein
MEETPADPNDATQVEILRAPVNALPVAGWPFALPNGLQDHRVAFLADRPSVPSKWNSRGNRTACERPLVKSFARAFAGVSDRAVRAMTGDLNPSSRSSWR